MTPAEPLFHSFWSINAPLDESELCRQLDRLRAAGLDGVVFHPRFYPGEPPYLSDAYMRIVSRVILRARETGMRFWLYDENGWPSGTVGGALPARHPEAVQQWVGLWRDPRGERVGTFRADGVDWWAGRMLGPGVDYLGTHLARRFLEMTYERYRDGLEPDAWAHVEGFFCDEPEFGLGHAHGGLPVEGAIPWTSDLPHVYRSRCDGDLTDDLPALFFDCPRSDEVRVRFWELVTDLFVERFIAPMSSWAQRHGKLFAAHMKGEETPLFQAPLFGSGSRVLPALSLPAIDALERRPGTDYHPRQVSTASRQRGDGRAMVEAWGGSGWGGTPGDLERFLIWLGDNGLTDFVLHISQYRFSSAAQDDWPPSQPLHLTWREAYSAVLDAVRERLGSTPRPPADVLLVAPVRAVMAAYRPRELVETNVHDGGRHPATPAAALSDAFMSRLRDLGESGVNVDVVDERTAETARSDGESVLVGRGRYETVVVDPGCVLAPDSARTLARYARPVRRSDPRPASTTSAEVETHEARWRILAAPINALPLEPVVAPDGWFEVVVELPGGIEARLAFADDVSELRVNGAPSTVSRTHEGSAANLGSGAGLARVRFRLDEPTRSPRVRVEGIFSVTAESAWEAGEGTFVTEGGWALTPPPTAVDELVTGGYPFLRAPLEAVSDIETGSTGRLRFDGAGVDAIGVELDGRWCGWAWERDGEYVLPAVVEAGSHRIRAQFISNGFNAYGPHHYVHGDAALISPDQIVGRGGFADPPGTPAETHDAAWRFRRMGIPMTISVLEA